MDTPIIATDRAAAEAEPDFAGWDAHGAAFWAPTEPAGPVGGPARMVATMAAPGALWWPGANNTDQRALLDGGSLVDGYQPKGLWHTTETSAWPSYSTNFHPHITVALVGGRFVARGHIRHDRGARALRNIAGGVQTNRGRVWQVEIVTRADIVDVDGLPAAMQDGLGRYAEWLHAEWGVPKVCTVRFRSYPSSYGENNGVRLSPAGWQGYRGWCGHMHCPENDHGDPGALVAARILEGDDMLTDADKQYFGREFQTVVDLLDYVINGRKQAAGGRQPTRGAEEPNNVSLSELRRMLVGATNPIDGEPSILEQLVQLADTGGPAPINVVISDEQLEALAGKLAPKVADVLAQRLQA